MSYHTLLRVREDTHMIYHKEAWRSHVSSSFPVMIVRACKRSKICWQNEKIETMIYPSKPSCKASADPESSASSSDSSMSVQTTYANGDTEIWVQYYRRRLNLNDKIILQRGDELSDKHIQFAQKLIKEQFPFIGGLFSTLLQEKCYNLHDGSDQIIHCLGRHHWIAVSSVGCNKNSVHVYDSLFPDVDATTCALIKNIFGGDECEISMKKV